MARIPEDEVERLKREVSVQRLAEARGIKLVRHGANLVGRCPFHDDRTPSLVITPGKNLWHCMGACNAGGTAIDWVMRSDGVSFRHAVELLKADHLPLAAASAQPVRKSTVPKLPPPVEREADDRALLLQVVEFYNETLKQSPEALKYLQARGLQSAEIIDRFKLGFANRTLGYRLPAKNRAAGAEMRGRLQQLGVYRQSGQDRSLPSLPPHDGNADARERSRHPLHPGDPRPCEVGTTQIYTHVSIRTLQQVHPSTHPAAMLGRSASGSRAADPATESLFQTLASEGEDDGETAQSFFF